MRSLFVALAVAGLLSVGCSCGPSARELRERTLSTLNTEADRWDGGKTFDTQATDAYGQPLTASVEKGTFNYVLEVRSSGPDGLPKNSDDITVQRTKRHGETTYTEEAAKSIEVLTGAAASGTIKGIGKGLGLGGSGDKKKGEERKR
jgi:hypothetical protein